MSNAFAEKRALDGNVAATANPLQLWQTSHNVLCPRLGGSYLTSRDTASDHEGPYEDDYAEPTVSGSHRR